MSVAAAASLLGAALPLFVGAVLPGPSWIVLVLTVGALGALGWTLGGLMVARRARWAIAMLVGGVIVTVIGVWLDIT
ncbi:hypothetical protein OSC27_01080 [Microbacterium sp. STN6]|uniref:hypothetical protein n=1 Tax=Microbacterium sp. STN6 TaxID=2995588 RepID=UPI002260C73A|nr:hypothetical protein [Microbacterium sp. STN6]MCX7520864.1 hypothetical protein [Microbacterium sp. STN6]